MSINYSFGLALKHNFAEYIYYEGLFLPHEIDKIINFWADDKTIKATVDGENKYKDEQHSIPNTGNRVCHSDWQVFS